MLLGISPELILVLRGLLCCLRIFGAAAFSLGWPAADLRGQDTLAQVPLEQLEDRLQQLRGMKDGRMARVFWGQSTDATLLSL